MGEEEKGGRSIDDDGLKGPTAKAIKRGMEKLAEDQTRCYGDTCGRIDKTNERLDALGNQFKSLLDGSGQLKTFYDQGLAQSKAEIEAEKKRAADEVAAAKAEAEAVRKQMASIPQIPPNAYAKCLTCHEKGVLTPLGFDQDECPNCHEPLDWGYAMAETVIRNKKFLDRAETGEDPTEDAGSEDQEPTA